MQDAGLWRRISAYRFPDGFEDRVLRQAAWAGTRADVTVAVAEYRRFLYLARIAPEAVTPSQRVDDIWHVHLTDTEDYWHRLCPLVLGGPLHHRPGTGRAEDGARHAVQYARTLDLYRAEFRRAPPVAVWPEGTGRGRVGRRLTVWVGIVLTLGGTLIAGLMRFGPETEVWRVSAIVVAMIGISVAVSPLMAARGGVSRRRRAHCASAGCGASDCGGGGD